MFLLVYKLVNYLNLVFLGFFYMKYILSVGGVLDVSEIDLFVFMCYKWFLLIFIIFIGISCVRVYIGL